MSQSTCKWPECELPAKTRGFCTRDYARGKREGNYADPWTTWTQRRIRYEKCRWPDCEETVVHGWGLCKPDYQRATNVGTFDEPWKLWNPGGNCVVCGEWASGAIHNQRFCSTACNMLDWKRRNPERVRALGRENIRRRRARIRNTTVDRFTDQDVRDASGDICYLCGVRINYALKYPHPKSPTLDHVVPLKFGGSHTLENCAMAHFLCNQKKHVSLVAQVPQLTLFKM